VNKALFLDRDGVINVDRHYVHRVEDFEFVDGIFDLCARARALGHRLVVVTNQAGIARGYYGEAEFQRLTRWMRGVFEARGAPIDRVYHCPYHPTAGLGDYRRESFDRKPNPGMLLRARDELGLDLTASAFVGDKDSDMAAGRAAGVGRLIRLLTDDDDAAEPPPGDVTTVHSLAEAAVLLEASASPAPPLSGRR
jgi:D-glycero-D-manno-heptose 1,7-bisphosphate phosphatase